MDYKRPQWWGKANCAGTDPDLFYPPLREDGGNAKPAAALYAAAAEVCAGCEVRDECLEWGMEDVFYGMYGGLTPAQRRDIRTSRSRQRAS